MDSQQTGFPLHRTAPHARKEGRALARSVRVAGVCLASAFVFVGCATQGGSGDSPAARSGTTGSATSPAAATGAGSRAVGATAEAVLKPTQGNQANGKVTFTQRDNQLVLVSAAVSGLRPGGHGFHIHEKGDCSAPDASSAGGHYNPTSKPHGSPDDPDHHVGDMPMLEADANGDARMQTTLTNMTVDKGPVGIIGRAVIVHVDPDDFRTQPTGNAGGRIACGVIEAR